MNEKSYLENCDIVCFGKILYNKLIKYNVYRIVFLTDKQQLLLML